MSKKISNNFVLEIQYSAECHIWTQFAISELHRDDFTFICLRVHGSILNTFSQSYLIN